ncbi:enoyl-CoA hydratase-related protein [Nocardia jejuensis]|uniref:enoyl-CoA hydratase-related protein n=1 Tax=Nocardia jejuensis TaxID=328049 RepID=UPI000B08EC3E|nr:enoyl-CoA hydratase-related protein [Nocardia jejuensis]
MIFSSKPSTIEYTVDDGIATITLNRPHARNGFTTRMANELGEALAVADADDDIRVVVLAGAGPHFCVGMDMSDDEGTDDATDPAWIEPATRVVRPMTNLNKPVIVAIHGAAIGVGITMTLAADFRLAATDSRFGFVFGRRGLFPEGGSMWFLPRIVGLAKAKEWMVSGRVFDADEALAAGLVTSLHAREELLPAAYALARDIAIHVAPVSAAAIRRSLVTMAGAPSPEAAFELDRKLISGALTSADLREGISSFLEKRTPRFPGRISTDLPDLT